MIHPNMATMLTFITTDAAIDSALCNRMVKEIADQSFNMVVVDGDTSTNDTMIVMANGLAGNAKVTIKSLQVIRNLRSLTGCSQRFGKAHRQTMAKARLSLSRSMLSARLPLRMRKLQLWPLLNHRW
jgi:N-acetylglutamate synthase/N-acetylornithine aminotransferase